MPKFPEPPSALTIPAMTMVIPKGSTLFRIYFGGGQHPGTWNGFRFWGPTASRFDHQLPPKGQSSRGILYAAWGDHAVQTCLAEVFQASRVIDRNANSPWLVGFETTRDLVLLDLTGQWPTRAGASMAISTGQRPRAQRWSQRIYAGYGYIDGIGYGSSMNGNHPSLALYERALTAMPNLPLMHRALSDGGLTSRLATAANALNYRL